MRPNQKHSLPQIKAIRSELRNNLTPAEAQLWQFLKNKQCQGRKFRRQHSIEMYVVDFYCAAEKLIIELDGAVHYTPEAIEQDKLRDEKLAELGFKVLRFENHMVFSHIEAGLTKIESCFFDKPSEKP